MQTNKHDTIGNNSPPRLLRVTSASKTVPLRTLNSSRGILIHSETGKLYSFRLETVNTFRSSYNYRNNDKYSKYNNSNVSKYYQERQMN